MAWAPGKGMKDKQWKEYWEVDLGVSYIPIDKLDPQVDMAALEEVRTSHTHTDEFAQINNVRLSWLSIASCLYCPAVGVICVQADGLSKTQ